MHKNTMLKITLAVTLTAVFGNATITFAACENVKKTARTQRVSSFQKRVTPITNAGRLQSSKTSLSRNLSTSSSCCNKPKPVTKAERRRTVNTIYRSLNKELRALHDDQKDLLKSLLRNKPDESLQNKLKANSSTTLAKYKSIPGFPFITEMGDLSALLKKLQSGKIKFKNCQGKPFDEILKKVQQQQKAALALYYKKQLKKIGR